MTIKYIQCFNWFSVLLDKSCEARARGEREDGEEAIGFLLRCGGLEHWL